MRSLWNILLILCCLLLVLLLEGPCFASGQGEPMGFRWRSYPVAFGQNSKGDKKAELHLLIATSSWNRNTSVVINTSSSCLLLTLTPGEARTVTLDYSFAVPPGSAVFASSAVVVKATGDLVMHAMNVLQADGITNSDMVQVREQQELGQDYFILSYVQGLTREFILVVAACDNTQVNISLPDAAVVHFQTKANDGVIVSETYSGGMVISKLLQEMDVLQITGEKSIDLSGARVIASLPVAVFSGSNRTRIGRGENQDYVKDQLPSVQDLGTEHITLQRSPVTSRKTVIRILAAEADTNVTVERDTEGALLLEQSLISSGEFRDLNYQRPDIAIIKSSKPVLITQFSSSSSGGSSAQGDPSMWLVPSRKDWRSEYIFPVTNFNSLIQTECTPKLSLVIAVIIPKQAADSVQLKDYTTWQNDGKTGSLTDFDVQFTPRVNGNEFVLIHIILVQKDEHQVKTRGLKVSSNSGEPFLALLTMTGSRATSLATSLTTSGLKADKGQSALCLDPCGTGKDSDHMSWGILQCIASEINDETVAPVVGMWKEVLTAAAANITSVENVTAVKKKVTAFVDTLQGIKSNVTKIDYMVAQDLLASVDTVSQLYDTVLGQENDTDDVQNRIIQAVEVLGEKIVLNNAENGTVRLVTNNIALEVWNLSRILDDSSTVSDEYTLGLQLTTLDGEPSSLSSDGNLHQITDTDRLDNNKTDIAVQVPASLLKGILKAPENAGKDVRMSMSIFLTPNLFKHGTLERTEDKKSTTQSLVLNSKVIMASVTVDGVSVSEPFGKDRYMTTVYLPNDEYKDLSEEVRKRHSVCVFWDFSGSSGRGSWSDKGCRVNRVDKGRVVCVCNHLTNFAVLFDMTGVITDKTVAPVVEMWKEILTAAAANVTSVENVTAIKKKVTAFVDTLQGIKSNVTKIDYMVAQDLLASVDTVSHLYDTVLGQENDTDDVQNRIIQAVEVLGEKIVLNNAENGTVRLVTNNIALEVWNLSRILDDSSTVSDEYTLGLQLMTLDGEPSSLSSDGNLHQITDTDRPDNNKTDIAVQLPASLLKGILKENAGKDVRMSMSIFLTPSLFKHGTLERTEDKKSTTQSLALNSKVIMASITVDGVSVSEPFGKDRHVTTVYLPNDEYKDLSEEVRKRHSVCVFWDFSGSSGRGSWSDKGCHVDKLDKGRVVCACNHLTNFAVLFDLDFNKKSALYQRILSNVSIFGLSLSIVGLSCTVISFVAIRKWRKGRPQQTIFNMSLAMLFAWVIFLAGFSRVENRVGCLAVAVLLHYFILASFMWMLVEAILQYMLIIKVTGNSFRHFMTKTVFSAWGLPLVPVIALLSIDVELYNGYENYCWMSKNAFYFAFLIPASLIMIFNLIVYVMVVVKLCRLPNAGKARGSGVSGNLVSIRASIGGFFMLGLSWVFAYLTVTGAGGVFQYLFTITTTLQGLLIFLLFTARDPVVKAFWRQQYQKCRLAVACANCCGKDCCRRNATVETAGTSETQIPLSNVEMSQIL